MCFFFCTRDTHMHTPTETQIERQTYHCTKHEKTSKKTKIIPTHTTKAYKKTAKK